jgi:hypothetical protein
MKTSMLKTLACRHRSTVAKMAVRYSAKINTPHGIRACFEARVARDGKTALVARFGGIPLRRQKMAVLSDQRPVDVSYPHKELVARVLAKRCELCQQMGEIEVHHVRKLADLTFADPIGQSTPDWVRVMIRRGRKALVVCVTCHGRIHSGS